MDGRFFPHPNSMLPRMPVAGALAAERYLEIFGGRSAQPTSK
jgi:hypothetical protein